MLKEWSQKGASKSWYAMCLYKFQKQKFESVVWEQVQYN